MEIASYCRSKASRIFILYISITGSSNFAIFDAANVIHDLILDVFAIVDLPGSFLQIDPRR